MWRFENAETSAAPAKRAARLIDSYLSLSGKNCFPWSEVPRANGLSDVRASRFLRPYNAQLACFESLRLRRIHQSIRAAAQRGEIFHLWWHPHNFGVHQEENLSFLRKILEEFQTCRTQHGMLSLTMSGVHSMLRQSSDTERLGTLAMQS
jgi:hypothetical protein